MSKEEFISRMIRDAERRMLREKETQRRLDFEVVDYIGQTIAKQAHKYHRRARH